MALVADLNSAINDWSDFEDSAAPPPPPPGAGVKAKRAASGKSKAAKGYLRKGPKKKSPLAALGARAKSTSAAAAAADGSRPAAGEAQPSTVGEVGWAAVGAIGGNTQEARVRIEESGSAKGRQATIIRGLEAAPRAEATEVLRQLKLAVSVGGKLRGDGAIEIQGAHADTVQLLLERQGYQDVRLSGGAASRRLSAKGKPLKPAWNAPKPLRERAAVAEKQAAAAKAKAAKAAQTAKRSASAVKGAKLSQLRKSEVLAAAGLTAAKAVGAGKGEVRKLEEKLARIRRMIVEEEG